MSEVIDDFDRIGDGGAESWLRGRSGESRRRKEGMGEGRMRG